MYGFRVLRLGKGTPAVGARGREGGLGGCGAGERAWSESQRSGAGPSSFEVIVAGRLGHMVGHQRVPGVGARSLFLRLLGARAEGVGGSEFCSHPF